LGTPYKIIYQRFVTHGDLSATAMIKSLHPVLPDFEPASGNAFGLL
jgi:hypothetical protein